MCVTLNSLFDTSVKARYQHENGGS